MGAHQRLGAKGMMNVRNRTAAPNCLSRNVQCARTDDACCVPWPLIRRAALSGAFTGLCRNGPSHVSLHTWSGRTPSEADGAASSSTSSAAAVRAISIAAALWRAMACIEVGVQQWAARPVAAFKPNTTGDMQ
jgi:hypothetical protein